MQSAHSKKIWYGLAGALGVVIVFIAYGAIAVKSALTVPCAPKAETVINTPAKTTAFEKYRKLQLPMAEYAVHDPYYHHRIPSMNASVILDAWWIPAKKKTQKTIILVHGVTSSKHSPRMLFLAGVYHKAGFNVLSFDLSNHGASTCATGMHTAGQRESKDLLAVKQWLQQEKQIPAVKIGVHGVSLGAITALVAMGIDKDITAVVAETPAYDMPEVARSELQRKKVPSWLIPWMVKVEGLLSRLVVGTDLDKYPPRQALFSLEGRSLMVMFSSADERIPAKRHMLALIDDALTLGAGLTIKWLIGAGHDGFVERMVPWYEKTVTKFFQHSLSATKTMRKNTAADDDEQLSIDFVRVPQQ